MKPEISEQLDAIKFLSNRFIENVWKHLAVYLVALGWILSSDSLRAQLQKGSRYFVWAVGIFAFLHVVHLVINVPLFLRQRRIAKKLAKQVDEDVLRSYTVSDLRFAFNEAFIAVFAFAAMMVLWRK